MPQCVAPEVFALIPARGGSRGVPHKNKKMIAGKPLVAHTIDAALASGAFKRILVSSDDQHILDIARNCGVESHARPASLAFDVTPTDPVIADCIKAMKLPSASILVLLQPTSPLRTERHIREALTEYNENGDHLSVVSVVQGDSKYLKAYVLGEGRLEPLYTAEAAYSRRQELPSIYLPNGAIYIFRVADFLANGTIPRVRIKPYIMSRTVSYDIDTLEDFEQVQALMLREDNVS